MQPETNLPFEPEAYLDCALSPEATADATIQIQETQDVAAEVGRRAAQRTLVRRVLMARNETAIEATRSDDGFIARRLAARIQESDTQVPQPPLSRRWPIRIAAAAVLALCVGALSGIAGAEWRVKQVQKQFALASAEERNALDSMIQIALESKRSGETFTNQENGLPAKVTPVRTYKSVSGQWCREFVLEQVASMPVPAMRALACRTKSGKWQPTRREI